MADEISGRQAPFGKQARHRRLGNIEARPGSSYLLPFGKHKGAPVNALPDDYLQWLSTRELREPLRSVVTRELQTRGRQSAIQVMSARLDEAHARGFFVVQEGRESEVREYQESCAAAKKPSVCVALGDETATVAISYVGTVTSPATISQLQQTLARQWLPYAPHYLPPASIVLLGVPRDLVLTRMPELVELLDKTPLGLPEAL